MSFTKQFRKTMQNVVKKTVGDYDYRKVYQQRLINFRKEPHVVVRIENPTNIVRAKSLGYKAKQGVFITRVRVRRGSGLFRPVHKARRPKRHGFKKLTRRISIQRIAEIRASSKYPNAEIVNSYWVGEDGRFKYFEVILADRVHPSVLANKNLKAIVKKRGRAERGLTSAGRKNRGLRNKGHGAEKIRPSLRANNRKAK